MADIDILDPKDREAILKIADWYFAEWQTPVERTMLRLSNQPGEDVLFQLVVKRGEEVIATGGLCHQVNILKVYPALDKYGPWVALLYTAATYRNQGWGQKMLEQIEHQARSLGLPRIYLYTFTAESLYLRCGWKVIARVRYKGQDTAIMSKKI